MVQGGRAHRVHRADEDSILHPSREGRRPLPLHHLQGRPDAGSLTAYARRVAPPRAHRLARQPAVVARTARQPGRTCILGWSWPPRELNDPRGRKTEAWPLVCSMDPPPPAKRCVSAPAALLQPRPAGGSSARSLAASAHSPCDGSPCEWDDPVSAFCVLSTPLGLPPAPRERTWPLSPQRPLPLPFLLACDRGPRLEKGAQARTHRALFHVVYVRV